MFGTGCDQYLTHFCYLYDKTEKIVKYIHFNSHIAFDSWYGCLILPQHTYTADLGMFLFQNSSCSGHQKCIHVLTTYSKDTNISRRTSKFQRKYFLAHRCSTRSARLIATSTLTISNIALAKTWPLHPNIIILIPVSVLFTTY